MTTFKRTTALLTSLIIVSSYAPMAFATESTASSSGSDGSVSVVTVILLAAIAAAAFIGWGLALKKITRLRVALYKIKLKLRFYDIEYQEENNVDRAYGSGMSGASNAPSMRGNAPGKKQENRFESLAQTKVERLPMVDNDESRVVQVAQRTLAFDETTPAPEPNMIDRMFDNAESSDILASLERDFPDCTVTQSEARFQSKSASVVGEKSISQLMTLVGIPSI